MGPIAAQSDRLTEAYHPWTNACVENVFNTLKREPVCHWHYATCKVTHETLERSPDICFGRRSRRYALFVGRPGHRHRKVREGSTRASEALRFRDTIGLALM